MKEDPSSMKEIEFNVFDALLQKSRGKSDSVRKECAALFRKLFPNSTNSLFDDHPIPDSPSVAQFQSYLDEQLVLLHATCEDIKRERNQT